MPVTPWPEQDSFDRMMLKLALNSGTFPTWPLEKLSPACASSQASDAAACGNAPSLWQDGDYKFSMRFHMDAKQSRSFWQWFDYGGSDLAYCRDVVLRGVWE
jgi:hypothetical protein